MPALEQVLTRAEPLDVEHLARFHAVLLPEFGWQDDLARGRDGCFPVCKLTSYHCERQAGVETESRPVS